MILLGSLWRRALYVRPFGVMSVTGYRMTCTSQLCLVFMGRRAMMGSPVMCVRSLYTGMCRLTEHKHSQEPRVGFGIGEEDITLRIYIGIFVFLVLFITGCSLYNNLYDQLSPSSPIRLHDNALEKCRNHPEIIETFGKNINDYGCFTPKRKEQKIWAAVYKRYHFKCMRLTFFISSSKVKLATVKVDLKKNTISGRYEVRFIIVEIEGDPKRTITVEENRYDHI